jgi:hypothetical protein
MNPIISFLIFFLLLSSIYNINYYPSCDSSCTSFIEALKNIKVEPTLENLIAIAEINGISNYEKKRNMMLNY